MNGFQDLFLLPSNWGMRPDSKAQREGTCEASYDQQVPAEDTFSVTPSNHGKLVVQGVYDSTCQPPLEMAEDRKRRADNELSWARRGGN